MQFSKVSKHSALGFSRSSRVLENETQTLNMQFMFRLWFFIFVIAITEYAALGWSFDNTAKVFKGKEVSSYTTSIPSVSLITCGSTCFSRKRNGMCNICGYDKLSKMCFISDDSEDEIIPISDNTKLVLNPAEYICANAEYLVNGRNPVTDAKLSASSDFGSRSGANWARLHTTPSLTTIGAWAAATNDANQYIQVQFNGLSLVTGVALQGRPIKIVCCYQRVTSFKFLYSSDCVSFLTVKDINGSELVFDGNTDQDSVVTSMLPSQVTALCARLNPVSYEVHISLRFDILGCPLN